MHDDESAVPGQRAAHRDVLAGVIALVETADCLEGLAPAEQAATRGDADPAERVDQQPLPDPFVQRRLAQELDAGAAARSASLQCSHRRAQVCRVDQRIGVDEEEPVAPRRSCAGIAHGRDVTQRHRDDPCVVSCGDLGGAIGRGVIDDDELELGLTIRLGGIVTVALGAYTAMLKWIA